MHALAEQQAERRVARAVQCIGQHLQFLGVADQARGVVQFIRADAAAVQQAFAGNAGAPEHLGRQGDGVQGGEGALFRYQ